jgi:hypothetical protein
MFASHIQLGHTLATRGFSAAQAAAFAAEYAPRSAVIRARILRAYNEQLALG